MSEDQIDEQSSSHGCQTCQRSPWPALNGEIDDPGIANNKDGRGERIAKGPVGQVEMRSLSSDSKQTNDGEHGKQGQGEADIQKKRVEGCGQDHANGNTGLQEDRVGWGVFMGIDLAEELEKDLVLGHSVIDPGSAHDHCREDGQKPQGNGQTEIVADIVSEQGTSCFGSDLKNTAHGLWWQGIDIDQVQQEVEGQDNDGPAYQGQGDVVTRIFYLTAQIGGSIPSTIGKGYEYQGDSKGILKKRTQFKGCLEMSHGSLAQPEPTDDKDNQKKDLKDGQTVLDSTSQKEAVEMDQAQNDDNAHCGQMDRRQMKDFYGPYSEIYFWTGQGKGLEKIGGKGNGGRGYWC